MIKIANNIQKLLQKTAQEGPASLPQDNMFRDFHQELMQANKYMGRGVDRLLQAGNNAYSDMVGPDGIPYLLARTNDAANDALAAGPVIGSEFANRYNRLADGVNQGSGILGNALNYVENQIPVAGQHLENLGQGAASALANAVPAAKGYGAALENNAKSLLGRLQGVGSTAGNQLRDSLKNINKNISEAVKDKK